MNFIHFFGTRLCFKTAHFYKKLIHLKQSNPALAIGAYTNAENDNSKVFSFYRINNDRKVLVIVNLSNELQKAILQHECKKCICLFGENTIDKNSIELNPYQVAVFEVK